MFFYGQEPGTYYSQGILICRFADQVRDNCLDRATRTMLRGDRCEPAQEDHSRDTPSMETGPHHQRRPGDTRATSRPLGFNVVPKSGFHKLAKMPRVGSHDDDLGTSVKGECLGSMDDVNIEVVRRRSWTSLLSGLCPKLRGEP